MKGAARDRGDDVFPSTSSIKSTRESYCHTGAHNEPSMLTKPRALNPYLPVVVYRMQVEHHEATSKGDRHLTITSCRAMGPS